jgi:phytoene dehydrogenase-like protein
MGGLGRRPAAHDAIVVGGGHNGLVAAAYLARAGLRTLLLERRPTLGGTVETRTLDDGSRAPGLFHTVGRLRPAVHRELHLGAWGLSLVAPGVRVFAPQPDGRAVTLWADVERTAAELEAWSGADALAWTGFDRRVRALAGFLAALADQTPPATAGPGLADAITGLLLGRAFKRLTKEDARDLLRVLPMAVADFVGEAFEHDAVRATVAARAVQFTALGVWSMGTTATLLADSAGNDGGAAGQAVIARGGPGALSEALAAAARSFGAQLRTEAEVVAVTTVDGRVSGVALANGEEIAAPVVASGLDPKRTLLGLLGPLDLGPNLRWRAGNIRQLGTVARVNLALAALPRFPAAGDGEEAARRIRGRITVGATGVDDLERAFDAAKYGRVSERLLLEATIPTLIDPSLAAQEGGHVISVLAQYVPYGLREGAWDEAARTALGQKVVEALEEVAPGIGSLVTAGEVLTPADLEAEYGLTGGHPYHQEPGLDAWFAWRPLVGWARYRMPVEGLYLVGPGAHPGGGVTGAPARNAVREILADRGGRSLAARIIRR